MSADRLVPPPTTTEGDALILVFSKCYEGATGKPCPQVRFTKATNRFRVYHRNGRRWAEYSALGILDKVVTLREIAKERVG